ncbi:MAG TPA: universal stress protein [Acidobacteriota bacterium]|nr:universal stress protein [Acidobacteriota bacterium]
MEKFRKILCPVDFSQHSDLALRYAVALSEQFHCDLLVYHTIPVSVILAGLPPAPIVNEPIWQDEVRKMLEDLIAPYHDKKIKVETRLESGDPAVQILRTASNEETDLIVMGTHGTSGTDVILTGSVTNKILHKTKVPVLVVCKPTKAVLSGDPDEPLLVGKILCAVDPAHLNLGALSAAMFLARTYHSTLFVITVEDTDSRQSAVEDLKELLQPERETDCKIRLLRSQGDPVTQILKAIEEYEVDLAIMGHHSTFRPFEALGSVSLRVIPRSKCAVLVVRD